MDPGKRELYKRAQAMRQDMTRAERRLWQELRGRKMGVKFRAQHVLFPCIVDFHAPSAGLCIEVDGPVHLAHVSRDAARDAYLSLRYGVYVLRFENQQVIYDLDHVLCSIEMHLQRLQ